MTTTILNTANIRQLNQELILAVLRKHGSASIAELARHADISIATCMKIVADLQESGQVSELEEREFRGGRPARRYQFNPQHALIAGLLLKIAQPKEMITWFVADLTGTVLTAGTDEMKAITTEEIEKTLDRLIDDYPSISTISLSIPGMVHNDVIGTGDIPRLTDFPLRSHLEAKYDRLVCVENDMNLCALGYHKCYLPEQAGLAYLLFPHGYATGGGLVINGKLVKGKSSFAGELSYLTFVAPRAETRKLLSSPERYKEYVEYVAKMIMAVAVLANPDLVVLSGDDLTQKMKKDLQKYCGKDIPHKHLPDLVIKRAYDDDCVSGMFVNAMCSLAKYPGLLEFSPMALKKNK